VFGIIEGMVAASVIGAVTITQDEWSAINTILLIILAVVGKQKANKTELKLWSNLRRINRTETKLDQTAKEVDEIKK
jgi:hypothetical protein